MARYIASLVAVVIPFLIVVISVLIQSSHLQVASDFIYSRLIQLYWGGSISNLSPRAHRAWLRVDDPSCTDACGHASPNTLSNASATHLARERCDALCFQSFLREYFSPPRDGHVDDCSMTHGFLQLHTRKEGLGSTLHGYMHALVRASLRGLHVCENTGWSTYSDPNKCQDGQLGMQCLFQPLAKPESCATNICAGMAAATSTPGSPASGAEIVKADAKIDHNGVAVSSHCAVRGEHEEAFSRGSSSFIHEYLVHPTFIRRKYSEHWYLKEILAYMLRPNARVQRVLDQLRTKLQLVSPTASSIGDHAAQSDDTTSGSSELLGQASQFVALHVRRGDHQNSAQHSRTDEEFVAAALRVASVTGVSVVLLCSDDFDALKTIPAALEAAGLTVVLIPAHWSVLHQHRDKCRGRDVRCKAANFVNSSSWDRRDNEMRTTWKDDVPDMLDEGVLIAAMIRLMAESVVCIGTLSSSIGRVVYMLQWQLALQDGDLGQVHRSSAIDGQALDPAAMYLDVNGAEYVSCGWRRIQQPDVSLVDAMDSWERRWRGPGGE
jgi:hypothetical protein